jgi:hypothetical protein
MRQGPAASDQAEQPGAAGTRRWSPTSWWSKRARSTGIPDQRPGVVLTAHLAYGAGLGASFARINKSK